MTHVRALSAIVREQCRGFGYLALASAAGAGIAAGLMLRAAQAPLLGVASMVAYATIAAVASTLVLRIETRRRDWFFFSVPLYGRELARALSILPVAVALAFSVALAIRHGSGERVFAAALLGPIAPALIVQSATVREGKPRLLYLGLALLSGVPLALMLGLIPGDGRAITAAAAFAFIEGFLALRAYGETLARFDPL